MARSVVSGLTVRIGADTTTFSKAMQGIGKEARTVASDLKTVSDSLKLDPGQAETYANKMKLLKDAVSNASTKVDTIRQAIRSLSQAYTQSQSNQEAYKKGVEALEKALKDGNITSGEYKKKLADLKKEYGAGKISQQEYETGMKNLKRQLESATYEQDRAEKSLRQYTTETWAASRGVDELGDEQKDTNKEIENFGTEANTASKHTLTLGNMIKANLISGVIQKGLTAVVKLVKSLASHLADGAKALTRYSWDAVKDAAAYTDQIQYSETVFGDQSEAVQQWAKDNSLALRISEKDLLTYMNRLGQVFHSQGVTEEEALEMVQNLMTLAADIQAATGKEMDEILPTMERGFTTSVKNFRQFGVVMTDAQVKMYAVENGLVGVTVNTTKLTKATADLRTAQEKYNTAIAKYPEDSTEVLRAEAALLQASEAYEEALEGEVGEMDAATLAMARYGLLAEGLSNISGQNARESDQFNSQLNLTKTIMSNLKTEIGMQLLPVLNDLLTKFNEFLQSEEGQALLQKIVDQFKTWGDNIRTMMEDGRFQQFLSDMVEKLPQIIDAIGEIGTWVVEHLPLIGQLVDKVLQLFGIETEGEKIKRAFLRVEDQVQKSAENMGINIDSMISAINLYAEQNGIDVLDIYNKWYYYAPLIEGYIQGVATEATTSGTDLETALAGMDTSVSTHAENMITSWDRFVNGFKNGANFVRGFITEPIRGFVTNLTGGDGDQYYSSAQDARNKWLMSRAGGGPARAGRMYQVNDDAGGRKEMFVPSVPGYILNGDQTDRIINNNNQRTYGALTVNVISYGTNAAEIAQEIGVEVNRKLRMSGAML